MGNATLARPMPGPMTVHPHAHGERHDGNGIAARIAGSSPRTWGTLTHTAEELPVSRFIPTHMGNARSRWTSGRKSTVHPHAHGERRVEGGCTLLQLGSSPRTWGTPVPEGRQERRQRFIPTHMGNAAP